MDKRLSIVRTSTVSHDTNSCKALIIGDNDIEMVRSFLTGGNGWDRIAAVRKE
jgi:hypothetical protein